ncbi:uncharacterized protein DUF2848 [Paracoccus versutus]|uniref:Uncharacterized protein DUF2848 n=2 Tax=Paracoccus versutus TaxID=34007 RepID=A0A3D9XRU1_PARVE|nr:MULTISPECIES: DUF2848 domain-containing protein [Paracoccus]REF73056.1 uncharacterized protein DUF2848 [Paracoccus versutus]
MKIDMNVASLSGSTPLCFEINDLVIAGWAGRDKEAMEHHIRELEALGVKRPETTPTFYRVAANRLTTGGRIECNGSASSGEVETVIIAQGGKLYVGIGSDHTDREVETYGITVSKQMCDKPVGAEVWPFDEVAPHWDSLIIRSWLTADGKRSLYQEGTVAGLLDPADVIARYTQGADLPDGTAILGGTTPAIGGIRPGKVFECELEDPVLSRKLHLVYEIKELPISG